MGDAPSGCLYEILSRLHGVLLSHHIGLQIGAATSLQEVVQSF